ncbi:hypothetical protein EDB86DRAFT_2971341 [Lactarius hatsudake]|nr:hypothetical protein EDB86DRAFT_2971341 [Lactarius hatsudake]
MAAAWEGIQCAIVQVALLVARVMLPRLRSLLTSLRAPPFPRLRTKCHGPASNRHTSRRAAGNLRCALHAPPNSPLMMPAALPPSFPTRSTPLRTGPGDTPGLSLSPEKGCFRGL